MRLTVYPSTFVAATSQVITYLLNSLVARSYGIKNGRLSLRLRRLKSCFAMCNTINFKLLMGKGVKSTAT
jgi:hypothetical protein